MRRVVVSILVVAGLAACSQSHPQTVGPPPSTAGNAPEITVPSVPKLDVVLDDHGLEIPPGPIDAGQYVISFEDRRAVRPAGEHVALQIYVPGPLIPTVEIPAGTASEHLLIANLAARVVVNGAVRDFPSANGLEVRTTKDYPTPAT